MFFTPFPEYGRAGRVLHLPGRQAESGHDSLHARFLPKLHRALARPSFRLPHLPASNHARTTRFDDGPRQRDSASRELGAPDSAYTGSRFRDSSRRSTGTRRLPKIDRSRSFRRRLISRDFFYDGFEDDEADYDDDDD